MRDEVEGALTDRERYPWVSIQDPNSLSNFRPGRRVASADVTFEGLGMDGLDVAVPVAVVQECLAAVCTHVRSISRVHPLVSPQIAVASEPSIAVGTGVGLDSRVQLAVPHEIAA